MPAHDAVGLRVTAWLGRFFAAAAYMLGRDTVGVLTGSPGALSVLAWQDLNDPSVRRLLAGQDGLQGGRRVVEMSVVRQVGERSGQLTMRS